MSLNPTKGFGSAVTVADTFEVEFGSPRNPGVRIGFSRVVRGIVVDGAGGRVVGTALVVVVVVPKALAVLMIVICNAEEDDVRLPAASVTVEMTLH